MSDVVKVKVWVKTDIVNSTCEDVIELDREEWESMTEDQREDFCRDVVWNMAEWGYEADE